MATRKTAAEKRSTKVESDEAAIRQRAYEISQREDAGSAQENWQRAEADLRGAPDTDGRS